MDLSEFDVVQSAIVDVLNPHTGEPLAMDDGKPITVQVAGVDSSTFRERQYALSEERGRARARPAPADLDRERLETLATCLVGWSGITLDGKELPHSKDNAEALLKRLPWLAGQVDTAIVNRALHFKKVQEARTDQGEASKPKGSSRAAA